MVGGNEHAILIKDLYSGLICKIVEEQDVRVFRPTFEIEPDTGLEDVIRYIAWYVAGINNDRSRPHYRYWRYREILSFLTHFGGRRVVHVDIGCGAGLFSWAFLDWASAKGIELRRVRLFGLDHNRPSIRLAKRIRKSLTKTVAAYPKLHYFDKVEDLLSELRDRRRKNSDYVITFGHVLVQAQSPDEIRRFASVIKRVLGIIETGSSCTLIAVDARTRYEEFRLGWLGLRDRLIQVGIGLAARLRITWRVLDTGEVRRRQLLLPGAATDGPIASYASLCRPP